MSEQPQVAASTPPSTCADHEVVVIGAGIGGICMGIRLQEANIEDFVILERGADVGGTWRDNRYPDIGVDIPCWFYQYSFARNRKWTRVFPKGAEVLAYHKDVVRRYSLEPHLRFNSHVVRQVWNEEAGHWELQMATGQRLTAKFVVSAVGAFLLAKEDPGIPGWIDFRGKLLRPTDWDYGYSLAGKRVAVIGTGASSVQITPVLAEVTSQLDVYQRTPVWCLPKPDYVFGPRMQWFLTIPVVQACINALSLVLTDILIRLVLLPPLFLFIPLARAFDAVSKYTYRRHLRSVVHDTSVRAALLPDYGLMGKRPTISNSFLQAFNRSNVSLTTTPISRITSTGIQISDGQTREYDAIVLATGYHLFSDPESYATGAVIGRDGFDLGTFYNKKGLQAYESVSIHGLPNHWTVVGPYSWTGTSWHFMVEMASRRIVSVIAEARSRDAKSVEVSEAAHGAFHDKIRRQRTNMASYFTEVNKGLRTYYLNSQKDCPFIRPTSVLSALSSSRRVNFDDYDFSYASPSK
ncbi:hypothetical protein CDD80_2132 [Ophiocordyceps camponoti-rufipedis]|uniref:FAD/NAD(P)-binding domain-containing protein n=1 Tax=Ophiocordyceps camponoti-rufipedis TaxID=2004952 RepID=A0A2C5ZLV0_9HYPO|nr:hypothetical protein CDD80_2132 [Ophiocordyceps camponoti-rufipedis]